MAQSWSSGDGIWGVDLTEARAMRRGVSYLAEARVVRRGSSDPAEVWAVAAACIEKRQLTWWLPSGVQTAPPEGSDGRRGWRLGFEP